MQQPVTNQFSQQQNLPTVSQGFGTQQWSNQIPDIQTQTNQNFPTQLRGQNQPLLTNTFVETTTIIPNVFHLQGFLTRKSGEQQSQSDQLIPPPLETTTVANNGIFMGTLRGWQKARNFESK